MDNWKLEKKAMVAAIQFAVLTGRLIVQLISIISSQWSIQSIAEIDSIPGSHHSPNPHTHMCNGHQARHYHTLHHMSNMPIRHILSLRIQPQIEWIVAYEQGRLIVVWDAGNTQEHQLALTFTFFQQIELIPYIFTSSFSILILWCQYIEVSKQKHMFSQHVQLRRIDLSQNVIFRLFGFYLEISAINSSVWYNRHI